MFFPPEQPTQASDQLLKEACGNFELGLLDEAEKQLVEYEGIPCGTLANGLKVNPSTPSDVFNDYLAWQKEAIAPHIHMLEILDEIGPVGRQSTIFKFRAAHCAIQAGQTGDGIRLLTDVVRAWPDDAAAYSCLMGATMYYGIRQPSGAARKLLSIARKNPEILLEARSRFLENAGFPFSDFVSFAFRHRRW